VLKPNTSKQEKREEIPSFAQEMNDFQKLGALNSHLKREDLSYQNKVLIIY
jgi:hypothetical protein